MPIKPIVKALREARSAILQIALFNSVIDSLVMYLILALGCVLLALPAWWALVPAFAYALVHTRANLNEIDFKFIEKKFPNLEEQLITVADNVKETNEIIDELNEKRSNMGASGK